MEFAIMMRRLIILLWVGGLLSLTTISQSPPPDRIGVRVVDGQGEFYDTVAGGKFTPRGVNYIDWQNTGAGVANRVFDTRLFNPDRIRDNFRRLAQNGYKTVRIFFDSCNSGPTCIGNSPGRGLNEDYVKNIADTITIAAEEGVYLLLTSNDLPDSGGYGDISNRGASPQFAGYRNAHYLTAPGIESAETYWRDFMQALMQYDPPTEAVLGWSILNEQWFFGDQPPLSLNDGVVETANGEFYDLSDPDQKRAMTTDNILLYINTVYDVIRENDPDTLITMGFFAPQFPNSTGIGGSWFVDTAPLLERAPLDFFDFHAYPGGDISVTHIAENFGLPAHPEKPIIMGEVGAFRHSYANVELAAIALQEWIADSCASGFDGWLVWEYFGGPLSIGDATWGMIAEDGFILDVLSPINHPTHVRRPASKRQIWRFVV
jgi:hypothetical protein